MNSVVTLYLEVVGGSWKREIQPSSGIEPLTAGADETSTPPVQAGFCAKQARFTSVQTGFEGGRVKKKAEIFGGLRK